MGTFGGLSVGGLGMGGGLGGLGLGAPTRAVPAPASKKADRMKAMAEKAKQQLQQNATAAAKPEGLASSDVLKAVLKPVAPVVPLKGSLKRKHAETDAAGGGASSAGASKRVKRSVKWADVDGNGSLKEEHVFEVERIKKTVTEYKCHRDLVKKEKQLEKDLHLRKGNEQEHMQHTIDWRRPEPLVLSMDITDAIDIPVVSPERDAQARRLAHVLETRYVDDSLIPSEPDVHPDAHLKAEGEMDEDAPVMFISWGDSSRQQPQPQ